MISPRYCPACFREISPEDHLCPFCRTNIRVWSRTTPYTLRLIHALNHPHSEVRMGAIISLGKRKDIEAALPLAECALRWPTDVVQGLEIVQSIALFPSSREREEALNRLLSHPAHAIRTAADRAREK